MRQKLKHYDFTLFFTPLALTAFGVVMIYSASMVYAVVRIEVPSYFYLLKQLQWFAMGGFLYLFFSLFSYKKIQRFIKLIVFSVIGLLMLVLLIGKEVNNAQSWFDFGVFSFQPAELAKLGIILYLASVYSKKQEYINDFSKAVVPPLIMTFIICGLIGLQPDIGTGSIVLLIAASVIISSGIRVKHLIILLLTGIVFIIIVAPNMVTDERAARFSGAYEPFEDPNNDGYHLIQSYIAIGTGGLTGEGLGQSVQKLGYLLEPHTDFIMAVIAEELGLIGVAIVIGLLAIIVLRGFYIASLCKDQFGSLLAIGISSMIGIQTFINVGAVSGILPITGVTLPFVSYGGSSLLVLMVSMGILNNIAWHVHKDSDLNPRKKIVPKPERDNVENVKPFKTKGGKQWVK